MPQPPELLRLADLPHGTPARLAEIRGGHHLTRRLLALGLRQGSRLLVLQRRGQGLVLACGEVRVAVGAGIADKLWVTLDGLPDDISPEAPEESDAAPETSPRTFILAGAGQGQ